MHTSPPVGDVSVQPAVLHLSLRLQDVCTSLPEWRRHGQRYTPLAFFRRDEGRVRCRTRVAVPCEGDPEPTRPVASSSRSLRHVPPRPDKLELQASFDRDEHRFRLPHVHLTPGTAEFSLPEGGHRLHEGCCRHNGFDAALSNVSSKQEHTERYLLHDGYVAAVNTTRHNRYIAIVHLEPRNQEYAERYHEYNRSGAALNKRTTKRHGRYTRIVHHEVRTHEHMEGNQTHEDCCGSNQHVHYSLLSTLVKHCNLNVRCIVRLTVIIAEQGDCVCYTRREWHWRPGDLVMAVRRHTTSTTRRQTRQEDCVCCYPSISRNIIHQNILYHTFKTPMQYLLNITDYTKKTGEKLPGQSRYTCLR